MTATTDPTEAAAAAGLRHVDGDEAGLTRRRCGRGFTYLTPTGRTLRSARERARIEALAIPPAWQDVWICADPQGHVQATGRDALGRKQYRYHEAWEAVRAADKFEQLGAFGSDLVGIRRQVGADLAGRALDRTRVLAAVVRLLDRTLIRVGNPEYAQEGSYGLTTLEPRHVRDRGRSLLFGFPGKAGVEQEVAVTDAEAVAVVRACRDLGGPRLFTYRDDAGGLRGVDSTDVNEYLGELAGPEVSARDFRTWGATVEVVGALAPGADGGADPEDASGRFLAAVDRAAARLGNTRDICRSAYVHPAVEEAHRSGRLAAAWRASRRSRWSTRAERATLRLLDEAGDAGD